MDKIKYFEQIKQYKINLLIDESKFFSFASKTSIHSEVTDWAYGKVLERNCVDISDGNEISGEVFLEDVSDRFFLKIIACMPKWQKFVVPLTIKINETTVFDDKETFFEQVNLGWPALYIAIPSGALKQGKNTIIAKCGGNLYLSELSFVSYPKIPNLAQVSIKKHVRKGDRFAVAIKDQNCAFCGVKKVVNCQFISAYHYKDLCVLSFKASQIGSLSCVVRFGDQEIQLDMPKSVDNQDDFVFGIDSDDHRHDNSDETTFIVETTILSDMGNFIQFRPQLGRNYYKLLNKKRYTELINLIAAFGMKYGLCDCDTVLEYLPDIKPENFYGYHIHEPYLFFNPALLENPFEKEKFLCEPDKISASQSFGESKELYMHVLKRSKELFSKDKGLSSFGSPSLLCVYEAESGVDRITIEPVSNINLLTGAVRASNVKKWGAHVPTDWYFGVPVDKVKSNKYRLAMQYLYLNGASYLYAENSLFKTNAFERCDWESEFCCQNRKYQREFYEYALTHPRKGKLVIDKAFVYGKNEFFMWKLNDRIAELKEKDWDSNVWGKWDNAYQIAWNASEAWLPTSDRQNVCESPLNKNLFSGTPYGNVDVIGAEKDFSKYSCIAFLGWNTMDDAMLYKLKNYVHDGGTLMISFAQFNYIDRNDKDMVFPKSEKIKEFIGLDICGTRLVGKSVCFEDKMQFDIEENIQMVVGKKCGAKTICVDENNDGVVYENAYGKGKVYFIAFRDYVKTQKSTCILSHVLTLIGNGGDTYCDNNNVSFTTRETENEYRISVLNMNCLENADEEFNIIFREYKISGAIKVGEIKEFVLGKSVR